MCHCFQGIYCLRSGRCPSLSNHRSRWYKSLYKCSASTRIIWLEKHFWSHSNSTSVQIFVLHIYGSVCLLPVWDQQFSTLLFCIYMVQFNFYLNTWLFYIWFSSLSSCLTLHIFTFSWSMTVWAFQLESTSICLSLSALLVGVPSVSTLSSCYYKSEIRHFPLWRTM